MKRLHLFEFEDFPWFPNWIRALMTNYIQSFHKILQTDKLLLPLVKKGLLYSDTDQIIDLCSGSGGPMIEVFKSLKREGRFSNLQMKLTDLYPNQKAIAYLQEEEIKGLSYQNKPQDVTRLNPKTKGLRTLVSGMHHMRPEMARKVLHQAQSSQQPILVFEISDNSAPTFLWWLAIPVAFLISLFVTPFVRPLTWKQLVFTYLVPIVPLFIAWDGAVSNVRTYTLEDMVKLTDGLSDDHYQWEMGKIKGKGGNKLYLLGKPERTN
ncbi:DUF2798 domain-containing protein [Cecembia lonarensis]|nr:DUF2798 domain-containing protein [Cecembia lonarensis]